MRMSNLFLLATVSTVSGGAFGAKPPADRIPESKAKSIALREAPGTVTSSELEFERKQWVYSFDIRGADRKIHEVLVNATSGKIVESTIESASKEAKEASEEASEAGN
jgi:uncharacterized membrane protein YkoI